MSTKLIKSAAYFRICPECGRHGVVVTADGEESDHVITVQGAIDVAFEMSYCRKITEEEMPELIRQIEKSGLPEDADDAMDVLVIGVPDDMSDSLLDIAKTVRAKVKEFYQNNHHPEEQPNGAMEQSLQSGQGKPRIH